MPLPEPQQAATLILDHYSEIVEMSTVEPTGSTAYLAQQLEPSKRNTDSLAAEIEGGDRVEHGWREQGLAAGKSVKSMLSK